MASPKDHHNSYASRRRRKRASSSYSGSVKISPVAISIMIVLIVAFFHKLQVVVKHNAKTLKPIFPRSGTANFRVRPLACSRFVHNAHKWVKDPNQGRILVSKNTSDASFVVSVNQNIPKHSNRGWNLLQTGHFYQTKMTKVFKQIMNNSIPEVRLIEVGASFGWFSLLARSLEKTVDIFEPNLVNVLRICQSAELNRWSQGIDIYPYGLTEEDGSVLFQYHEDGTARINDNWGHKAQAFALDSFVRERGWLERSDEVILLKIDVANHVPQVIKGASELLESGMVKNLLVDMTVRHGDDKRAFAQALRQLLEAHYVLKQYGYSQGPSLNNTLKHDKKTMPQNILKLLEADHKQEMTFWWTLKEDEG